MSQLDMYENPTGPTGMVSCTGATGQLGPTGPTGLSEPTIEDVVEIKKPRDAEIDPKRFFRKFKYR